MISSVVDGVHEKSKRAMLDILLGYISFSWLAPSSVTIAQAGSHQTHQGRVVVVADGQGAGGVDQKVVGEAHVFVVVHDGSHQGCH
eukprot:1139113-Pelagomonas_calceolata.AAC.2